MKKKAEKGIAYISKDRIISITESVKKNNETAQLSNSPKGKREQKRQNFIKDFIGEPHYEDYRSGKSNNELIISGVPFVSAAIDKYVDWMVGSGFYVNCYDNESGERVEEAEKCLGRLMRQQNFDLYLREIAKHGLSYGFCATEITKGADKKISALTNWHPDSMYVKLDEHNQIKEYVQWFGQGTDQKDITVFDKSEIAFYVFNKIGDKPYGTSIIQSLRTTINDKLASEKDMRILLSRKANAPIHVKVGDKENAPSQAELDTFGSDLQLMKAKTEWVTNALVDMKVVGFEGQVMNLLPYIQNYDMQLAYGTQVPLALMGNGNIAEGLAIEQSSGFMKSIESRRQVIETELENKIFRQELDANNFMNVYAEFEWHVDTEEEKMKNVAVLAPLMNPGLQLHSSTRRGIEEKIRHILDITGEMPEDIQQPTSNTPQLAQQSPTNIQPQQTVKQEPNAEEPKKLLSPSAEPPVATAESAEITEFEGMPEKKKLYPIPVKEEYQNNRVSPPLEEEFYAALQKQNDILFEELIKTLSNKDEGDVMQPAPVVSEGWITTKSGHKVFIDDAFDGAIKKLSDEDKKTLFASDDEYPVDYMARAQDRMNVKEKIIEATVGEKHAQYNVEEIVAPYIKDAGHHHVTEWEEKITAINNGEKSLDTATKVLLANKNFNTKILSENGKKETLTLYRGVAGYQTNSPVSEREYPKNQFVSFTEDIKVAERFAFGYSGQGDKSGKVITEKIPIKDIWFSYKTDPGFMAPEKEYVVFTPEKKK